MSLDKLDTLERERREADRQYNGALTAFDAVLLRATSHAQTAPVSDSTFPEFPDGWRGWIARTVHGWLSPWMERQQTFNARTAESLEALIQRESQRAVAFEQFQAALITFLQRITAFVESKDRQLAGTVEHRAAEHQRATAALQQRIEHIENTVPELRTQIAVLRRATTMLKPQPAGAQPELALPVTPAMPASDVESDYKYVAFEDAFRGSYENIAASLADYLPVFAGTSDVVDLGCGRGEFLTALKSAGVSARGVDTNAAMVAAARERGLDVTRIDALGYIASLPDESLGGAIATQVVEHLAPPYLIRLLEGLARTLRPGAPVVLETINPASWYAFFSSYIRDLTHAQPLHPETLQYMLRASGFERVEIRYRSLLPDSAKLGIAHIPADVRASSDPIAIALTRSVEIFDWNIDRLNELMFGPMDYAVVGYKHPNDRDAS